MNDHSYSKESVEKTEKKIKQQLEGNGVDVSTVALKVKRHGVETLRAQTSYELDCKVEIHHSKGKVTKGRLIQNGELQKEISEFKEGFAAKETTEKAAKETIKALPLQGFGAEKLTAELPAEKTILTEHVTCNDCKGQQMIMCPKCQGQMKVKCPKCYGRGELQCELCLGHGTIQDGESSKPCYKCQGKGEYDCYRCQGKRFIPCTNCHMKGKIPCNGCNGEGTNSVHATLIPFIKTHSAIHVQDLEDDAKRMAGKIGGQTLANSGHIDIRIARPPEPEEEERAYFDDEPEDQTKNSVYYEAEFPWAVGEIKVDGKAHDITFAGKKGAVCESGHFMEQLIEPSLQQMDRSLRKQESAQGAIKSACTLRVSRETFTLLGKKRPKKVMQDIYKIYPLGWSKNYIQTFVITAYKSLNIATRRPRYIGLGVGLCLSLLIYFLWFVQELKPSIALPTLRLEPITDVVPLLLGMVFTILSIKGIAFVIYNRLMRDIGIKSLNTPPLGKAGLYALLGNLALWGGFMAARYFGLY